MSKKNTEEEPKARALTSTNSDRWRLNSSDTWQLHVVLQITWRLSLSVQQVIIRVCRYRTGYPAAVFVQPGGGARGGGAANREPASCQRIRHRHILWRRCPGPKVKTIHSVHPLVYCQHSFLLVFVCLFVLVELLLICLLNSFSFFFFYIFLTYLYFNSRSSDNVGAAGVGKRVFVRVCFHKQSVCWVFVLPPLQITNRQWAYVQ